MLELPSFGELALLLTTVLFLSLLTFVARPYYRVHAGYGSPPITMRTGLMAFACTPILNALTGKANVVTLLTGIGHEKLNVIHRWVGWITLALSLVNTVPFVVASRYSLTVVTEYDLLCSLYSSVELTSCRFSLITAVVVIILSGCIIVGTFAIRLHWSSASMPLAGACSATI